MTTSSFSIRARLHHSHTTPRRSIYCQHSATLRHGAHNLIDLIPLPLPCPWQKVDLDVSKGQLNVEYNICSTHRFFMALVV
jgi:hypothetical protein